MTQITWNAPGEQIYEAGVDHGVLYIDGIDGVPWNGLISVSESSSGGQVTPYYVDGIKYLNHQGQEEFEATIEAYTYPEEFGQCDGTVSVQNGLFATKQKRKSFGLSYRTQIGNDTDGIDHGYKIHLVYNATAEPTDRPNNTMSESIEPYNFSWHVLTKPPMFTGMVPTAHFIIDSRETPSDIMVELTDILYGTDVSAPRLPSVTELLYIFKEHELAVFDSGVIPDFQATEFDAGATPSDPQTTTIDGGVP